jgi:hypothetical protein
LLYHLPVNMAKPLLNLPLELAICVYSYKYFNQFLKFITHNCVKYNVMLFTSINQISRHKLVEFAEIILRFINNN